MHPFSDRRIQIKMSGFSKHNSKVEDAENTSRAADLLQLTLRQYKILEAKTMK